MHLSKSILMSVFIFLSTSIAARADLLESLLAEPLVEVGSVRLSPGGEFISMVVPKGNRSDLVIINRITRKPTALISPRENEYIADYWWVENNRVLATLGKKLLGEKKPFITGELWAIDADGKNSKYLFGYRDKKTTGAMNASATVLESTADEDRNILIGFQKWDGRDEVRIMELARLNIADGRLLKLNRQMPMRYVEDVILDQAGRLKYVLGVDAESFSLLYEFNQVGKEFKLLNNSGESGVVIEPLAFYSDGKTLYARTSENVDPAALSSYDPKSGVRKIILKPKYANVENVFLTADKKTAYAIATSEERGGYALLDNNLPEAKLVKSLMVQFQGQHVIANSFSRDGQFATIFVFSDRHPGTYYLYDSAEKKLWPLVSTRPKVDPNKLATMQVIQLQSRDGKTLRGFLTEPVNTKPPFPLVVLPHGGPIQVQNRWGFDEEVQLLANAGYAVLQINFRGSSGYGNAFEIAARQEWGGKMQDDVTDATLWAIAQGKAAKDRVCIMGASYGGYAALMGVAKEPKLYQCAIGLYGVYDLELLLQTGDVNDTAYGKNYLAEYLSTDKAWLKARSPVHKADNIVAKVFLMHGGRDRRAPATHAKRMRAALQEANNEPEWYFEQEEGHGFFDQKNKIAAYQKILKFLAAEIGSQ